MQGCNEPIAAFTVQTIGAYPGARMKEDNFAGAGFFLQLPIVALLKSYQLQLKNVLWCVDKFFHDNTLQLSTRKFITLKGISYRFRGPRCGVWPANTGAPAILPVLPYKFRSFCLR